ncbi:MAG: peroxidase [Phycisphaerales bacterium]|nr:MAG: peroxidase [Phycisphaerales bacterium]
MEPADGGSRPDAPSHAPTIDALVSAVATDYRTAALSPPERAALDFAVKLTHAPQRMTAADVEDLRRHGYDDRAIHDLVQVTAYFNYINRIADGLGVDLEPDMPPRDGAPPPAV